MVLPTSGEHGLRGETCMEIFGIHFKEVGHKVDLCRVRYDAALVSLAGGKGDVTRVEDGSQRLQEVALVL